MKGIVLNLGILILLSRRAIVLLVTFWYVQSCLFKNFITKSWFMNSICKKMSVLHEKPLIGWWFLRCVKDIWFLTFWPIKYDACLKNDFFLRMRCHFAVAVFSKDHPNALKIACTFMMWHFPFTNQYRNQYWRINFIEKENIFSFCNFSVI